MVDLGSLENMLFIERGNKRKWSFPVIVYCRCLFQDLIVEKGRVEFLDLADHIVGGMIAKVM